MKLIVNTGCRACTWDFLSAFFLATSTSLSFWGRFRVPFRFLDSGPSLGGFWRRWMSFGRVERATDTHRVGGPRLIRESVRGS